MTQYPADDSVCEAVVRGLLPQIHDPENKVQERVIQVSRVGAAAARRSADEGYVQLVRAHLLSAGGGGGGGGSRVGSAVLVVCMDGLGTRRVMCGYCLVLPRDVFYLV